MKIYLFGIFLCLWFCAASAQETRKLFVGFETGITTIEGEISKMENIRGRVSRYEDSYSPIDLGNFVSRQFVGIKTEFFTTNNKVGVMSGVRLTRISGSVGQDDFWSSNSDYFYFLLREDGLNTNYLRVKEINQISNYVGIPLEVRYFPFKPRLFRVFFKLAVEANYLYKTNTDVAFYDPAMNQFEMELTSQFEQPKAYTFAAYAGGGIRYGRNSKPSVSIEANAPYFVLTPQSSGLVNPEMGFGIQLNFQIPINSKEK